MVEARSLPCPISESKEPEETELAEHSNPTGGLERISRNEIQQDSGELESVSQRVSAQETHGQTSFHNAGLTTPKLAKGMVK